jgi:hypothetical protein
MPAPPIPTEPASAECRVPLPDGQWLTVVATTAVGGHAELAGVRLADGLEQPWRARLGEALLLARFAEGDDAAMPRARFDLGFLRRPFDEAEAFALVFAAVVADRAARSRLGPAAALWVTAVPGDLPQGAAAAPAPAARLLSCLQTLALAPDLGAAVLILPSTADALVEQWYARIRARHPRARWVEANSLGALAGTLDVDATRMRRQEVFFPVVRGEVPLALQSVQVQVRAAPADAKGSLIPAGWAADDPDASKDIRQTLGAVRDGEPPRRGDWRWHTLVGISGPPVQGGSWQLALAVADRLARGRDFAGRGRVLATGKIDRTTLAVQPVDGMQAKLQLLARELRAHDTVLLPAALRGAGAPLDLAALPAEERDTVNIVYVDRVIPQRSETAR